MDFWATVKVVFKRWYVSIPSFVAALGVAFAAYAAVPTEYVSTSILLLTTPRTGPTEYPDPKQPNQITNPFLDFDQGLNFTASILIQALAAPETAEELGVTPGQATAYVVTNGSSNPELVTSGPFIFIQATSSDPQRAQDLVTSVAVRAGAELAKRQAAVDAPKTTYISISHVVPPTTPQARKVKKLRAAAAAGALASFAGLAASFAFESLVSNRVLRRRRPASNARNASHPASNSPQPSP